MADETEIITPEEGNGDEKSPEGGEEGAPDITPIKIGDKEYTPEQLTGYIKKATDYDNLLPDYTKKSQALATLLGGKPDEAQQDLPSFLKEGWKPKNFAELGSALKEAVEWGEKRSAKATEEKTQQTKEAKEQTDNFVKEVLKSDKDFDQKEFFQYIVRHKIAVNTLDDLKAVYSTYSEANADGKMAERRVILGKVKRGKDSVSKPSSEGEKLPYDATEIRTKSTGIVEAAKEALSKLK